MALNQNQMLHRRWLEECWTTGDLALQDELLAVDVFDNNPVPGVDAGIAGQHQVLAMFHAAFAIELRIDLLLADGDHSIARWTGGFTHRGDFMGLPATGVRATVTGINIARCEDGKIAEIWHQQDLLGLMNQLQAAAPA